MEKIQINQQGPLQLTGLPQTAIQDVEILWQHSSDEDEIAKHLGTVLGKGRVVHYAMVRRAIQWKKARWDARLAVRRQQAQLRVKALRSSQLRSLTEAIGRIPGASDLRLKARRP